MAKYYSEFDWWCKCATKGIKYRPDRQEVYGELYQHIEDRYLDFLEQGMKEDEAIQMTLRVMGDADEIAPQLAAIHRPFWGYVYSLCKWSMILLLLTTIFKCVPWFFTKHQSISDPYDNRYGFHVFDKTYFAEPSYSGSGEIGYVWKRIFYTEPDCKASSDGYTFSIRKAALWNVTSKSSEDTRGRERFYIEMEITNPLPWAEFSDMFHWFWAEDSLGNYYYSEREMGYYSNYGESVIQGDLKQTGLFTYTYSIYVKNFVSDDAEWIDLHYDRAGRDIVLRINLTGGETS